MAKAAPGAAAELWEGLDFLFLALSLVAVWASARHSSDARARTGLWVAWGVFAAGIACEHTGFAGGAWLMYLGSAVLVVLHGAKLWGLRHAGGGASHAIVTA